MLSNLLGSQAERRGLLGDDRGLSTVEYVIILVLIAASAIGLWATFGKELTDKLGAANTEFTKVKIQETP